jgi:hypothetical protein
MLHRTNITILSRKILIVIKETYAFVAAGREAKTVNVLKSTGTFDGLAVLKSRTSHAFRVKLPVSEKYLGIKILTNQ